MAVGGYIKLFRQMTEWEWYRDTNVKSVFLHLLLIANHDDKKWCGKVIKRGQVVTSRDKLAYELGLSEQQIRTALEKLASTGEILRQSTNKYTLLTICKYADYQANDEREQPTKQPTNNQQSTNNQPTNNHKQECKEIEEYNNNISLTTAGDFEKMRGDRSMLEALAILNRVTVETIQTKINEFEMFCKAGDNRHYSASDLRQHFRDWLRKSLTEQKTANNGINNTGSKRGYFEPDANQVYSDGFNQ